MIPGWRARYDGVCHRPAKIHASCRIVLARQQQQGHGRGHIGRRQHREGWRQTPLVAPLAAARLPFGFITPHWRGPEDGPIVERPRSARGRCGPAIFHPSPPSQAHLPAPQLHPLLERPWPAGSRRAFRSPRPLVQYDADDAAQAPLSGEPKPAHNVARATVVRELERDRLTVEALERGSSPRHLEAKRDRVVRGAPTKLCGLPLDGALDLWPGQRWGA